MIDADYHGYVRTTDEDNPIIDLGNTPIPFQIVDGIIDFNSRGRYKIVKQANTIDELCDRFVLIDRNEYESPIDEELIGKRYEAMFDEFKFRLSEGSLIKKMSFYGAVWTGKGLTYVAKMDGEGRLTLMRREKL